MGAQATKRVVTYDADKIEEILRSFDENLTLKGFRQIDTVMTAVNYLQSGGTVSEVPAEENAADVTQIPDKPVVVEAVGDDSEPIG